MGKKAIIIISLVRESEEKSSKELEREIFAALLELPTKIPWMKEVKEVKVTN